jgi:hypothetical protein
MLDMATPGWLGEGEGALGTLQAAQAVNAVAAYLSVHGSENTP